MSKKKYEITYRKVLRKYNTLDNNFTQVANTMIEYITNGNQFRVYTYLCCLYNKEYDYSFPSVNHIAEKLKMNRKTVINCLKKLEEQGYIIKKNNKDSDNKFTNNVYFIRYIDLVEVKREIADDEEDIIIELSEEDLEEVDLGEFVEIKFINENKRKN